MRRISIIIALFFSMTPLVQAQDESKFHAEFRLESERLKESCSGFNFKAIGSCAQVLFTDHPLHIAAGSIAPQNGVGFGPAFVYSTDLNVWRLRWNSDAVVSSNGSWRAGLYLKAYPTPTTPTIQTQPVISAYLQAISLNKLGFFGLGSTAPESGRSYFGMTQTIAGTNVLYPVSNKLKLSLYGEINGRFVDIRGRTGESSPSIEQIYTEATAPGLTSQPAYAQFGEGIRLRPNLLDNHIKLNYFVVFQQFVAPGDSRFSFRRVNFDLAHEFPLYHTTTSSYPKDTVGPDGSPEPPAKVSFSRNREGSVGVRLLISESIASAGHVVPFYFQPTLGGSDVNGERSLPSYQDYRFRAPNLMLLRGDFEHSIWGPLGFNFMADYGKAALTRGDLDFNHMRHSFGTGVTIRAGNFPQVWLMFAWGGREGDHTIGYINPGLLGGTSRPSLF